MNSSELKAFFEEVVEAIEPLKDIMKQRRLNVKANYLKRKAL